MKVSRFIALGLLIPLSGMAVLAVYLNAQEPAPVSRQPVRERRGPALVQGEVPGSQYRVPYYGSLYQDPLTLQLLNDEQAADQEARGLAATYAEAANDELRGNIKNKLREKLAAIFEMQQKRRTAEIASIEERLAKLKDISKKRETNKDPIVDRRLEQLTGGVDDLGWEESNRGGTGYPAGQQGGVNFLVPTTVPRTTEPAAGPPARTPTPAK